MIARIDGVAKNVGVTDKLKLTVEAPKDCKDINNLVMMANCEVSVYVLPRQTEEGYHGDSGQLDFIINCPECESYHCKIGQHIALCLDCGREFDKVREDCQLPLLGKLETKALVDAYKKAKVKESLIDYLSGALGRDVPRATHITDLEFELAMEKLCGKPVEKKEEDNSEFDEASF